MKAVRKVLVRLLVSLALIYVFICTLLYFNQESILFHPGKLAMKHQFESDVPFEELFIQAPDGIKLNALLFKAEKSKGLIFYVHGNAGSLNGWKGIAETYTKLGYDLFIFDFRGFGKSQGEISSEEQFYGDVRLCYRNMKERYVEKDITIVGYSIGTGSAAMLAAENNPNALILLAPYYNLHDMMRKNYRGVPAFILRYRFETNRFLPKIQAPVSIFHGKDDKAIYFGSSLKLQKLLKPKDQFFPLEKQGHIGMDENVLYQQELKQILGL